MKSITRTLRYHLLLPGIDGPGEETFRCRFSWLEVDPRAATLCFLDFPNSHRWGQYWSVARDLLLAGLDQVAGHPWGNLQVFPDFTNRRRIEIVLSGYGGQAGFLFQRTPLRRFLDLTFESVPSRGVCTPDLDARWARWATTRTSPGESHE